MNKTLIISLVVVLGVVAVFVFINKSKVVSPTDDGTYVEDTESTNSNTSGTGTNTSIGSTSTSTTSTTITETTLSAKIGQTISLSGVTGTVKELVEDSRCPIDVECIQAGTVKVKVNFVYGALNQNVTLTLDQELAMYGRSITLVDVKPDKVSGTTIASSDYVFTFLIK
ncbi:hypothetical protein A2914_00230 [Candidatus Nomurabacteria bacterium RIFCSPLOWO2_01_FULL_41_21]|uniref:Uncharacterized protein n=2 Tax=Candidatus Nomuraibacteriota TaxID=1752729 RepID=A0A1F6V2Y7_9BACT|nr:MAG: hypothetical protein A2733_02635 [Candidatus Nomurabacteria bacterium RIFCSPHIGHO2_01_FULL_40_20]OGI88783.1 MAG: hypothetical protein A2914_00230 [Candidatus Nomurabacteria bacterium RIFCSPLOWO2_01_FULL_41_21]